MYFGRISTLAVSGTTVAVGTMGYGVFRSSDNGDTWTFAHAKLTYANVHSVAINGDVIFAGVSDQGVYRITSTSYSWKLVNNGLQNLRILKMIASNGYLIASDEQGSIFRSSDNGDSWLPAISGATTVRITAMTVNWNNLLVGSNVGCYGGSSISGYHWKEIESMKFPDAFAFTLAKGDYKYQGDIIYSGTSSGIFAHLPGDYYGWRPDNSGLTDSIVLAMTSNDDAVYAGTKSGVFRNKYDRYHTLTKWIPINNGLTNHNIRALDAIGPVIYAATDDGIFQSTNSGDSWAFFSSGPLNFRIQALIVRSGFIYAGTQYGGVFRSSDNGDSWAAVNSKLFDLDITALSIKDTTLYAGTAGSSVWKASTNSLLVTSAHENKEQLLVSPPLEIHPNPANSTVYISAPRSNYYTNALLRFADIYGKIMLELELPLLSTSIDVDISSLPQGIYVIELRGTNTHSRSTICIAR
jgi:photosystem II stability/assembly factor-like uncharacterized protein